MQTAILRPSHDLGALAAECHRRGGGPRELGLISALLTRATRRGVPEQEADLLSYLLFDRSFTMQHGLRAFERLIGKDAA